MAITSEIIGKLGGASVDVTPVNVTASGSKDSEVVMHTVNVPAGETWLVALVGTLTPYYTTSNGPTLHIGDTVSGPALKAGYQGLVVVQTGVVEVKIKRNAATSTDSFTGHVYAVKI